MRRLLAASAVLVAVAAGPGDALAGGGPARPAAGKWKITDGGSFTVGKSRRKVSGMTLPGCDGTDVKVLGKQKLTRASAAGYTNWVLGKRDGHSPIKVKVREGDKTVTGSLYFVFAIVGNKKDNTGTLTLDCGAVYIQAHH